MDDGDGHDDDDSDGVHDDDDSVGGYGGHDGDDSDGGDAGDGCDGGDGDIDGDDANELQAVSVSNTKRSKLGMTPSLYLWYTIFSTVFQDVFCK